MKHVSILVPQGYMSLMAIELSYQMLQAANRFLVEADRNPLFDIHLVGIGPHTEQATGLFTVNAHLLISEVKKTDLVLIPPVYGDQDEVLAKNRDLIPWIVEQVHQGAEVASFCIGAYLLAATGLLQGKECTTHWTVADSFRKRFPSVKLVDAMIITEAEGIYTSGGALSSPNLLLYLIEKHAGREIALLTAKTYAIDIDRRSQSAFMIFRGQRAHDDQQVKVIQDYIESRISEKLGVNELTARAGVGRRSLERRFKAATGNSISHYVLRVKTEAAKRRLESSRESVFDVMYAVGYTDLGAFRSAFRRITGITPQQYKNKYNRFS